MAKSNGSKKSLKCTGETEILATDKTNPSKVNIIGIHREPIKQVNIFPCLEITIDQYGKYQEEVKARV